MIQPTTHETPFPRTRERFETIPDPGVRLHTKISLLAHVEAEVSWQPGRGGHPRALILMGNLRLPELRAEVTFGSLNGHGNANGHVNGNGHLNGNGHAKEHRANAAIIPHRFTMATQLQHLALPAREENDVWSLVPAADGDPTWVERYAGRLGDEPLTFDRYVPVDMSLDVTFAPEERDSGHGTNVHVAGELSFARSLCMRLLFRDPKHSMTPPLESSGDEAELIVAGTRLSIPRQTVSRLSERSASMSVRVIETGGRVVCSEQPLTGFAPL